MIEVSPSQLNESITAEEDAEDDVIMIEDNVEISIGKPMELFSLIKNYNAPSFLTFK